MIQHGPILGVAGQNGIIEPRRGGNRRGRWRQRRPTRRSLMLHPSERSKVQGANESLSSARSAAHRSPPCRFFTGRFPAIQDTGVRDFVVGVFQRENWTVGGPSDEIVGYQPHDLVDSGPPMHTGSDVLCLHERIAAPATLRIPDAWIRPVIAEHPQILGRSPIQEHLPAFERGLRIGIEAEMP